MNPICRPADSRRSDPSHRPFAAAIAVLLAGAVATGAFCPASVRAADPASAVPYKLVVVLDVAKNRVMTDIFRQQIGRELREGLEAALGDLAKVDVRFDHPKLAEIRSQGLRQTLDGWKERSDTKTHFVLIDQVDNQYQIQAAQHDGPTATSTPVVRVDRTPDRAYVARAAALMIERDFGFSGTFAKWPAGGKGAPVQLELVGAGYGVPMSRWVKANDIFQVVQMFTDRPPEVVQWALVQIQEPPGEDAAAGTCTGRLFWRYEPSPQDRNHLGYRCVKLGAIRAPLRLRLLQQRAAKNAVQASTEFSVQVRRHGFAGEDATVVRGTTDDRGYFNSAPLPNVEPFDKVAFVSVLNAGRQIAQLPVRLLDEQTVVVPNLNFTTEQADALAQRFDRWQRQVDEAWLVHVNIFGDLDALGKNGTSREKLVDRAKSGLTRTTDDFVRLSSEKEEIVKAAAAQLPAMKQAGERMDGRRRAELGRLEQVLTRLKDGENELTKFLERQEKILQEESRPEVKAAKDQFNDAQLAETRADFEQAIELYRKGLAVVDDSGVRKHLEKLEADWAIKSPEQEHRAARKFVYDVWPTLDTAGLERDLATAKKALATFQSVGDTLSTRKLILVANTHVSRIKKEVGELNPEVNVGDEKPAERIKKITPELEQLIREALDFLKSKSA